MTGIILSLQSNRLDSYGHQLKQVAAHLGLMCFGLGKFLILDMADYCSPYITETNKL